MKHKIILGSLVAFSSMLSFTGVASADPPPGTGWDQTPDVVMAADPTPPTTSCSASRCCTTVRPVATSTRPRA